MSPVKTDAPHAAAQVHALLKENARQVDAALPGFLPEVSPHAGQLGPAVRHTLAGGKRVRPFVVRQAAESCGLPGAAVLPAACAFELLHTATLIHDDLPAIDNADLRRGLPASHVAFGEQTALLAGDALIIAAFSALARQAEQPETPADRVVRVVGEFARASGAEGVIGGEAADIAGERQPPEAGLLSYIHLHKTAALFLAAARAGAILAGADESAVTRLGAYGEALGLLFQVTDDLLDATAETATLGKPAGLDAAAGKQTYPAPLGLEGAQAYADEVAEKTLALAADLPGERQVWAGLVCLVLGREA
jgi:geranylgeranyl diphosphate synthase type II